MSGEEEKGGREEEKDRRYLSRMGSAKYLGISPRMFDYWVSEGRIRVIRAGRRRVIADRLDLDTFYDSLKTSISA